jgi:predicted nucleotidyltransferase
MNAAGIIAEYNPFHNGHLYHLNETKKVTQTDCVVAIMSGDFTQRGEPAILNKWNRAEMAIRNGVDLVLELPFAFACNSAEYFAKGAIAILDGLGCISHFSFGCESGDIEKLIEVSKVLNMEDEFFKEKLKKLLDKGISYPRAQYEALRQIKGSEMAAMISEPNNILAVEYLKQWITNNSSMKPIAIKRRGPGYHDLSLDKDIASASAIRNLILKEKQFDVIKHVISKETWNVLENTDVIDIINQNDLFQLIVYKVLTTDRNILSQILSVSEGLENKLKKAIINSRDMQEIIQFIKSKRYTETRIHRLLIHTLLNFKKENFFNILDKKIIYARILGISKNGAELLNYIKKQGCASIPILNNINKELLEDDPIWELLHYDILASDICNLLRYGEIYSHSDHVHKLYLKS